MKAVKRWMGIMLSVMLAAGILQVPVYAAETGETAVEAEIAAEEMEDEEIESEKPTEENVEANLVDEETAEDADSVDDFTEEPDLENEEALVNIQDQPVVDDQGSEDLGNAKQDVYTGDISDELEDQNGTVIDEADISEESVERNEVVGEEGAIKDSDVSDTHTEQIEEEVDVEQEQKTALAMGTTQPQPYFAYNADILAEADTISGVSYSDIIKFSMNGNWLGNSAEINYNLHGEFSSVSFIAGFMSGSSVNATMTVIADGQTLLEQEIVYDKAAKTYSLSMAGVEHLRISFKTSGYDTKYYGIANLSFVSEGNISTHEYTSDEFFDVYNAGVRTNTTTVEDAFEMGGNTYNGGYKMSVNGNWLGHTAKINFDFQNHFKEMSFDLCFISGPRSNLTYTIEADDTVLYDSQTLPYGSIPKHIKLDLTGVSGVVITVKNSEYDTQYCGIGSIQFISDGTPLGIKLNKTSAKLTSKERQVQLTGGVYPSDARNREYTLRSDTPIVAVVDENGLVTGRNKGTAVIFAESEYVNAPAQCKITSELPKSQFIPSQDGWGFSNKVIANVNLDYLDIIDDYYEEVYKRVNGVSGHYAYFDNLPNILNQGSIEEILMKTPDSAVYMYYTLTGTIACTKGLCFGMAASAALTKTGDIPFSGWKNWKDQDVSRPSDVVTFSKINGFNDSLGLYLIQTIYAFNCMQGNPDVVADEIVHGWKRTNKYSDLIDAVKAYQSTGKNPILIKFGLHTVVPYEVVDIYDDHTDVYIYDCNLEDGGGDRDLRKLVFTKDSVNGRIQGWYYPKHVYSSDKYSITYIDGLKKLSDHLKTYQSIDTKLNLIKSTCSSFFVTRFGESNPILKFSNGQFTGDTTQNDVVPVILAGDNESSAQEGLMCQLTDQKIVIHNTSGSSKEITLFARPDYALVVESDGKSTIQQTEKEGNETIVITPSKDSNVRVNVNRDDNQFIVEGEARNQVTLTYDTKEKTILIDGYNNFDVAVNANGEQVHSKHYESIDTSKYTFGEDGEELKKEMTIPGKTTRGDMFNLANNVKVTWKEVPGAKYYKVYREGVTDKKETRTEPVIVTVGLVGWDKDPGLTNGHAYRYKIVASLTGKGDSSGDSPLSYSKLMYRLKTVVIRSVKNTAPGKVTVKYDKTTSGDSYVLQYSTNKDMVGAKTKVVLGANNTSYVIGGLKKGKTYYISIRVRKKVNGIDYYTTFGVPKKVTIIK